MTDAQAVCLNCGVAKGVGSSYCQNCGNSVNSNAVICTKCGVALEGARETKTATVNGQDKITLAIVCFFLGGLGIHNFMMGENTRGILKIVLWFFGLSWIWALIDFIQILTDSYVVDAEARRSGYQPPQGAQTASATGYTPTVRPDDASSFGFALLGFLIPIVGLILYAIYTNEYPKRAASAGKGAIWGAIFWFFMLIVSPILLALVFGIIYILIIALVFIFTFIMSMLPVIFAIIPLLFA